MGGINMKDKTLITAHSGAENTVDNTLESICMLAVCGADIFEADVRWFEGRLVMSHDVPESAESAEVLEECFRVMQRNESVRAQMDLKHEGLLEKVDSLAKEFGVADRLVYAGSVSEADAAYARAHGLTVWYNNTQLLKGSDWISGIAERGFDTLNLNYGDVSEKLLAESAHQLSVWTVNDEEMIRKFLAAGVKGLTTKRPVLAVKLRDEIQKG